MCLLPYYINLWRPKTVWSPQGRCLNSGAGFKCSYPNNFSHWLSRTKLPHTVQGQLPKSQDCTIVHACWHCTQVFPAVMTNETLRALYFQKQAKCTMTVPIANMFYHKFKYSNTGWSKFGQRWFVCRTQQRIIEIWLTMPPSWKPQLDCMCMRQQWLVFMECKVEYPITISNH